MTTNVLIYHFIADCLLCLLILLECKSRDGITKNLTSTSIFALGFVLICSQVPRRSLCLHMLQACQNIVQTPYTLNIFYFVQLCLLTLLECKSLYEITNNLTWTSTFALGFVLICSQVPQTSPRFAYLTSLSKHGPNSKHIKHLLFLTQGGDDFFQPASIKIQTNATRSIERKLSILPSKS